MTLEADRNILNEFRVAAARHALGLLECAELPELATRALMAGLDSRSLRRLAGEPRPSWVDARSLFDDALSDLSVIVPERDQAARILARHYCEQIVSQAIPPDQGAARIWFDVATQVGYETPLGRRLLVFVGLASEWDDYPPGRPDFERQILDEAARLLEEDCQARLADYDKNSDE